MSTVEGMATQITLDAIARGLGGGRLAFGLSRHPWVLVVLLAIVVAVVIYQQRQKR